MSKKIFCNTLRIVSLSAVLAVLQQMYEIGVTGYSMVCLVCFAWSLAELIERRE